MNYWHMQLHPDNKWEFPTEKILRILQEKSVIGLGKKDSPEKIKQFTDEMSIGDIVAIKSGKTPIALVQVVGKSYEQPEDSRDEDFDWFPTRREIKVLDVYSGKNEFEIPQVRGTLNKCNDLTVPTSKVIIEWYKSVSKENKMQDIINLLKFKHQIILQGPPGTGKTRLATEIADKMVKPSSAGNPLALINDFMKNYNPNDEIAKSKRVTEANLLETFQEKYPVDKLKDITLKDYCIGTGDNDNFCWWIERGLKPLGYYFPGSSRSYLIYWKSKTEEYSKHGFVKNIENDEEAMNKIASLLHSVVSTKNAEKAVEYFGNSFLLKLLNSYYPNEYFPINSERMIDNALKLFGKEYSDLSVFDRNRKLNDLFIDLKSRLNDSVSIYDFMRFIANTFELKTGFDIGNDKTTLTLGESKLIQFHPAYSYEDFVRGIVAETSEGANISYNVKNKVLAEFAQKSMDNPSGNYVLIIDEINRANLPAVLGELIYALEYRGKPVTSMYEYEEERDIILPKNLFIIGTMNTADRSVGHIDYAIRRRFAFVDILSNRTVLDEAIKNAAVREKAKRLFDLVDNLFNENISPDFAKKDVVLGHSYFLAESEDDLKLKLEFEIKSILREYVRDGLLQDTAKDTIESLYV
jgi:MoxR-like ATPase